MADEKGMPPKGADRDREGKGHQQKTSKTAASGNPDARGIPGASEHKGAGQAPPYPSTKPSPVSPPHRSAGLKLLLVCGLALLMAIPALFVYGVVKERTFGADQALRDVAQRVGGEQSVLGPVLAVPFARAPDATRPERQIYGVAIAFAEKGSVESTITVEERQRGIYTVPVFDAELDFTTRFDPQALREATPADATPIWEDARLYLGVSDSRGVSAFDVTIDGRKTPMEPAPYFTPANQGYSPVPASNLNLAGGAIPDLETTETPIDVTAKVRLSGAKRFAVGPFAKDTEVSMKSNWETPSFTGGTLPRQHTANDPDTEGFTATWRVPYVARGIPGAGAHLNLSDVVAYDQRDMGVRFLKTATPYQSVERSLKYAAMFIGFVFLAYFLFEIASGARAHPAQYVLVGLAQTIFYLLLLAFAERIGFDAAFFLASTMTVLLTAGYAASIFRSRAYGVRALGVLSGIYGLIFVLMRAQENALIAGALASFTAIALTMYMTRNIDWYGDKRLTMND